MTRFGPPHGLRVELDVGGQNCMVSIDSRVGTVLLTIEPHCRQGEWRGGGGGLVSGGLVSGGY